MPQGYLKDGLKDKYIISKRIPGGKGVPDSSKPTDPDAEYFVLRIDQDPHARAALFAYSQSIRDENVEFATDLSRWLSRTENTAGAILGNITRIEKRLAEERRFNEMTAKNPEAWQDFVPEYEAKLAEQQARLEALG